MSDEWDWAKDDAYTLSKLRDVLGESDQWVEEERDCECGFVGLVQILIPADSPHLWFWDCPECAYEHETPAEVLAP